MYLFEQSAITMATIGCMSLETGTTIKTTRQDVIQQIEQAEKKSFARHEVFDFTNELKKRNVELVVIVSDASGADNRPTLAAYLVLAFLKPGNTVMMQKICVCERFRRQGIARTLINAQVERLRRHGTSRVQLWVDGGNLPAMRLYDSIGFKEVTRVEDYYAVGRTGVQMSLSLLSFSLSEA